MISWFKSRKDYPDFWNAYLSRFGEPLPQMVNETTFTVLDTETTGFNFEQDRILSIGALKLKQGRIRVDQTLELYLQQEAFKPESVEIHGLLSRERLKTLSEAEAMITLLEYLGNTVIVGHHVGFDLRMINEALGRMGLPKLKNRTLDTMTLFRASRIQTNLIEQKQTYSLDELIRTMNLSAKDRHTAAGDAMITALAFLKILNKLGKPEQLRLKDLLKL